MRPPRGTTLYIAARSRRVTTAMTTTGDSGKSQLIPPLFFPPPPCRKALLSRPGCPSLLTRHTVDACLAACARSVGRSLQGPAWGSFSLPLSRSYHLPLPAACLPALPHRTVPRLTVPYLIIRPRWRRASSGGGRRPRRSFGSSLALPCCAAARGAVPASGHDDEPWRGRGCVRGVDERAGGRAGRARPALLATAAEGMFFAI